MITEKSLPSLGGFGGVVGLVVGTVGGLGVVGFFGVVFLGTQKTPATRSSIPTRAYLMIDHQ